MSKFDDMDVLRLAERIWIQYGDQIDDRDTFNEAYNKYLDYDMTPEQDTTLRDAVFKVVRGNHPDKVKDVFKKAKGKDFPRDRRIKAKKIVRTKREYVRRGARRVDLTGVDIPQKFFVLSGRIKGRIVKARKTTIIWKNKRTLRYRDRRGRFVSVR